MAPKSAEVAGSTRHALATESPEARFFPWFRGWEARDLAARAIATPSRARPLAERLPVGRTVQAAPAPSTGPSCCTKASSGVSPVCTVAPPALAELADMTM